jgi:hypothetical protein
MRRAALLLLSGLSFACIQVDTTWAQPPPIGRPAMADPYAADITMAVRRFGVPEAWIRAIMQAESTCDPHATSPKGAMGLMQIMPKTWLDLRARYHLGKDPYDIQDNILAGAAYIRELFDRYGSPGWIAAYNAGPGRYEASFDGHPLPAETRAYVDAVAPTIGKGEVADRIAIASTASASLAHAPLFVAQPDRASNAVSVQANDLSKDASTAPNVRDVSAIVPQSSDLFVGRPPGSSIP